MESISVQQTARPIRCAFMVRAGDMEAAVKAATYNNILWGGIYNPIVPTSPAERMSGLLKAFAPDSLVDLTGTPLPDPLLQEFDRRVVPENDIFWRKQDVHVSTALRLGVGMLSIYRYLRKTELYGGLKDGPGAITVDVQPPWISYVAFVFGSFAGIPKGDVFENAYKSLTRDSKMRFDPERDQDHGSWLSPIQHTAYGLKRFGGGGSLSNRVVYLGSISAFDDLVEFWNIRATGRSVWFTPASHISGNCQNLKRMIGTCSDRSEHNPQHRVGILKAPSVSEHEFDKCAQQMQELRLAGASLSTSSPRFGVTIPYYVGDIHVARIEAAQAQESTLFDRGRLTPIKAIAPPILADNVQAFIDPWMLELSVGNPSTSNQWMCDLPKAPGMDRLLWRSVGRRPETYRITDSGLAIRQDGISSTQHLLAFPTWDVFATLLEHVTGLQVEQSEPGRFADRIIRKMGSLQFDCRLLKIRGVREVIRRLNNGSPLRKGEISGILKSTVADDYGTNWIPDLYHGLFLGRGKPASDCENIFCELLAKHVIRPGFTMKCESCFAKDWYHVTEIGEEYTCRYCIERQPVDFGRHRDWRFKTDGLFRIPGEAQGSLAVILALWRLNAVQGLYDGRYATGLRLCENGGKPVHELDYCFLKLDGRSSAYELVLGEAKNFFDYEERQLQHLADFADTFERRPFIAVATLKDEFSVDEKVLLNKLIDRGQKLIPLSRLDLDPYDVFERFKDAPHKYAVSLEQLSESCVHVHLRT